MIFGGLLFGMFLFLVFSVIVLSVLYIVGSIGLNKIAKKEGHNKAWLAWIPIGNWFLTAMLVEDDVNESIRGRFTLIFTLSLVCSLFIGGIFILFLYLPLILMFYAFYYIANRYSENAIVHVIIAVLTFSLSVPFQLFRFRNRKNRLTENQSVVI